VRLPAVRHTLSVAVFAPGVAELRMPTPLSAGKLFETLCGLDICDHHGAARSRPIGRRDRQGRRRGLLHAASAGRHDRVVVRVEGGTVN
jgi:hypothetical protein